MASASVKIFFDTPVFLDGARPATPCANWTTPSPRIARDESDIEVVLFDLPGRVVRDVHRSIAAGASQRRHRYTGKWLTSSDPLIFAGAASDDMSATVHLRLRLVGVASIKGRENLVTVAVGQHASAVNVFLIARRHAQRGASR